MLYEAFDELKAMLDAQSQDSPAFTIHAQIEPEIEPLRFEPDSELEEIVSEILEEENSQDKDPNSEEEK